MKYESFTTACSDHVIGRVWRLYERLASTNTLALSLLDDPSISDGTVIQAKEQLAGRGQHGRSWVSPRNTSILLSIVLHPPPAIRRPVYLTAWAAVSVCQFIEEHTGLEPTIKWPNDVLIDGKKVCGILIEQRKGTVVGIGLNLRQGRKAFEEAGLTEATSLAIASGRRNFPLIPYTLSLLHDLGRNYGPLIQDKLRRLEVEWRRRLGLKGCEVVAECHDRTLRGRVEKLAFDGVKLRLPGETVTCVPEKIRHLTAVSEE